LLLFGAVQATMVTTGFVRGERLTAPQWFGFTAALVGVAALLAPGATAPPIRGALLMLAAGMRGARIRCLVAARSIRLPSPQGIS
jgi:drug/metabolite transporter (DMT)-like permease